MRAVINIHEAKTHLSRIIEEVAAGKEVVIAKAGTDGAPAVKPKKFGTLKGKIHVPDNFNDPVPDEVLESFGFDLAK